MSTEGKQIVKITRGWWDGRATLGLLKIEGIDHDPIFTLENPLRTGPNDSRIPVGRYECIPYSGTKYKNVYLLRDVPGRSAILIHWGNTEKDTEGCILVGLAAGIMGDDPAVLHSRPAFELFSKLIGPNEFLLKIEGP